MFLSKPRNFGIFLLGKVVLMLRHGGGVLFSWLFGATSMQYTLIPALSRLRERGLNARLIVFMLLVLLSSAVFAQEDARGWVDELLVVDVNQQGLTRPVLVLRDAQGERYVSASDLQQWRLRQPSVAPQVVDGENYFALGAIKGLSYKLDEARQILRLEVPAAAFELTQLDAARRSVDPAAPVAPPGRGGFLNYDLFAENVQSATQTSAFLDLGVFNAYGTGTLSGLARHIEGGDAYASSSSQVENFLRLDTAWAVDNPSEMTSFRIGDTVSQPASQWGRSVRFGGCNMAPTSRPILI